MNNDSIDFDVKSVPLTGDNLIEASAGTGKTYSIAIMVLRLLLEKDIRIHEILMVTFTNAAVAELEERIRKFVRLAQRYSNREAIDDAVIQEVVDQAKKHRSIEEIQEILHSAVLNLDETAVMTIHGFCQQTLNEFAFETNQLFNVDLVPDIRTIIEEEVQSFWRKYVTGIETGLLEALFKLGLSVGGITDMVQAHMDGKRYVGYHPEMTYSFREEEVAVYAKKNREAVEGIDRVEEEFIANFEANREEIIEKCNSRYADTSLLPYVNSATLFLEKLNANKDKKYAVKLLVDLVALLNERDVFLNEQETNAQEFSAKLYAFAIQEIVETVENKKISLNQMSFDDMIVNMHAALNSQQESIEKQRLQKDLIRALQWKYKAVFIDEFQDTDLLQYEIFNTAFSKKSILFFIGDPKQSIYAWRKADINTYFKAKNGVDRVYSMQTNFRSSSSLVQALNRFFLPTPDFDTFYYSKSGIPSGEELRYIPVTTPKNADTKALFYDTEKVVPLTYMVLPNKGEIMEPAVAQIAKLLSDSKFQIKGRGIKPSDIGVLVRTKREGADIKNALSEKGIPAVTVTEAKILESGEALDLVYILEAIIKHSRSNVNRAVTTIFINWNPHQIMSLDEDSIIEKFRVYYQKWQKNGVYAALNAFINEFRVQQKLLARHTENGERSLTNLYHLLEVLHKVETRQHFAPEDVLDWLKVNRLKNDTVEDEMIQRIESDEEAVRIVTIHSSKGLEYNIVVAPFLDFKVEPKNKKTGGKTIGIRDGSGQYISLKRRQTSDEMEDWYAEQTEQENRRLLYVALTRAVAKCYIYHSSREKNSTLRSFIVAIDSDIDDGLIKESSELEIEDLPMYRREEERKTSVLAASRFTLKHPYWTQTSYSRLAASPVYIPKENYTEKSEDYDAFVFRELVKGAKTGNFIHFLFENIDFSDSERWEFVIERAINRFVPDKEARYTDKLPVFLQHVVDAKIETDTDDFRLSEVSSDNLLHEMEFDFPLELFKTQTLENLRNTGITIRSSEEYPAQIEGIMTGFVDLFFRHNGKYYVLDWKTNYLGPSVTDYTPEALEEAMTNSNYHLQYLIYTYAVKLYLTHRLGDNFDFERDFGGVLYLFVRGMRAGETSGVYFAKPTVDQVEKMALAFR